MKVLITGGEGQLGRAIFESMKTAHKVIRLSKKQLDITNQQTIDYVLNKFNPDYVFHAAAYTAVDQCEGDQAKAFQVNSMGAYYVAKACEKIGSKMIYISSDYVFDGQKTTSYLETDTPNPKSIYGLSKWLGEELVRKTLPESYIVRTSWLYGHGSKNFVNTMIKFALSQKQVNVVSDQVGSPTYVNDFANALVQLMEKPYGIYHISNDGKCNWYQFAKAIYKKVGADPSLVRPISTMEYGASAPRPAFSLLNLSKLEMNGISKPCHWNDALTKYLHLEGFHD